MTSASSAMPRASRGRAALVVIAAALALFGLASPTWFTATVPGTVQGEVDLAVAGAQAVPALGGVALVLLAAGAALGLVGAMGRRVVGALVAAGGLVTAALVVRAVGDPALAMREHVGEATGVAQLPTEVATSPLAWITIAFALAVVVLGTWHLTGRGPWPTPTSRHDRATRTRVTNPEPLDDPARAWDALSDGADPS